MSVDLLSLLSPPGQERKRQEWRKTVIMANDYNQKNRPIRFKIKGLIIIILPEPRNDYNHTSVRNVNPLR